MKKILDFYKNNFIAGLIALAPTIMILWVLSFIIELLFVNIPALLPDWAQPINFLQQKNWSTITLINFSATVVFLIVVFSILAFAGWSSKKYFGQAFFNFVETFIEKIPVLRSIYQTFHNLSDTFYTKGKNNFAGVKLIDYPSKGIKSIAFVTGKKQLNGEDYLTLFVPTTPIPTSGFFVMVKESETFDCPYTTEEAFKTIISLGMIGEKTK